MPKKIKTVITENGFEKEIEIEVPDASATWGDPSRLRILGKRNPRPEGHLKVTGKAKYASDIVLPGMCHGRYLVSPYASATVRAIDLSPAQRMNGVKAVISLVQPGASLMFHGQPIAAVAAITPEIAEDAVRAIRVSFEPRPHVVDLEKARMPASPSVRADAGSNVQFPQSQTDGDVDAAFRNAAVTHHETYEAQTRLHSCLETHGQTIKWDGNRLTVWASTQDVQGVKNDLGQKAGGAANVRVITEHMGGGFGSKFGAMAVGLHCADLAKLANAPVKFLLSRKEEQLANFRGPGVVAEVKLAAAADGTLLGADCVVWNNGGVGNANSPMDAGFYVIQPKTRRSKRAAVLTNTGGTAALRAPGHPQAAVIWDMALDAIAAKLNMDPIEFRKKNHSDPVRLAEWDLGARIIGWERRQRVPGSAAGVRKRGIGMGSATWGGGGRKSADCTIEIERDGSVVAKSAVQDLGTGARLYVSAIVAEELGLELKDVKPLIGDSNYGPGHPSGGSTTTGSVAPAVKASAILARQQILALASRSLGVKAEDLEIVTGGRIQVTRNAAKGMNWKEFCATLPRSGLTAKGDWQSANNLQEAGVRGCTFAEVEVDTETGKVTVLKVLGVQDCGFVLNRLQAENQVTGGIIQGIGTALLEDRRMDNLTGRMLNADLEEYKLCGAFESGGVNITLDPPYRTLGADERGIATLIFENPTGKVSGIGEPAIIGVQSAIANAIFNAIGVHVPRQPATPDRVLAALHAKKGAHA
jgi:xanthine dehydrogenase YagR molybdenum-binding subunit